MTRLTSLLVGGLILAAMAQIASAELIQIQLGGVDLRYNGGTIVDATPTAPDPLTNATFLVDGATVGVDTTDVTMDFYLPGVLNIPAGGGQVNSAIAGDLDLDLGDGEHLWLTLDTAVVSYIPLTSSLQFVFVGAASSVDDQQLPYGISFIDPVSVTFSTQVVGEFSENAGLVGSFLSSGTGEIQGVPEPATVTLLALGGLAILRRRKA